MSNRIHKWLDIESRYIGGGAILGERASDQVVSKASFDAALGRTMARLVQDEYIAEVCREQDTDDIAKILEALANVERTNSEQGEIDPRPAESFGRIEAALIEAMEATHPRRYEVSSGLRRGADYLRKFRIVASLAPDPVVYWTFILGNDYGSEGHICTDAFHSLRFCENWRELHTSEHPNRCVTLICYPCGALFLKRRANGRIEKVKSGGCLATAIKQSWDIRGAVPHFLSSGSNEQRAKRTNESEYLSVVLKEILPELPQRPSTGERTIVSYGWVPREHDRYLLDALGASKVDRIAVSVNAEDPSLENEQRRIRELLEEAFGKDTVIEWYDEQSPGCWMNPLW